MRNFYRTTDQNNPTEIMVALMHKQDRFQPTAVGGITEIRVPHADFPALTALTLGAMTICNTVHLVSAALLRCEPNTAWSIGSDTDPMRRGFAVILQASNGAMLASGDEAVPIRSREVWDFNAAEIGSLINKSEDDVFMLLVLMDID